MGTVLKSALANIQPAVTYEMIETVLELPQGYFTKYVPTTSPPGLLNALKAVPQWFRDVWNA